MPRREQQRSMTVPSHRDAESNRALLRAIAATNRFDLKALPANRSGALSSA
ncbi:MAG: hypothetical protein IT307_13575, partial [Chloroflexi bacterium]|nr:hypothetical protein [Chloroflexota bacterium]